MDRDVALAARIAARHRLPEHPLQELRGHGSVNRVFLVGRGADSYVLRFAVDPHREDEFAAEAWCQQLAAAHGVPVPRVVASGSLAGVPYGIQEYVAHVAPDTMDRRQLWETLGRYARVINGLPITEDAPEGLFSRFGRDLAAAWRAHLDYNLAELTPADPLISLGVFPARQLPQLREMVQGLSELELAFGLSHGDLAPRNVLVRPDGVAVLIDWGSAACGPVPYTDLLVLQRDQELSGHPDRAEEQAFAEGYGFALDDVRPTLRAIRRLTAVDTVRWALDRRPDLVSELAESARALLARPS